MATAYIGIGSNLGDRERTIHAALLALERHPEIHAVQASSLYETQPVGGPAGQGRFLNAAARLETSLGPHALLAVLQQIESVLGRVRQERWGPRTIDLDLLVYDHITLDTPDLTLPHPRLHERRFVLEPLVELAPQLIHPRFNRTMATLLADLEPTARADASD